MAEFKAHEWEALAIASGSTTSRMRVPGGWIYLQESYEDEDHGETTTAMAMCFVPDPAANTTT